MKQAVIALALGISLAACGKSDLGEEPPPNLIKPAAAAPSPTPLQPLPPEKRVAAKNSTPAELIETCFNCIKAGDWETYAAVSITMSEVASPTDPAAKTGKFDLLFKPQEERRHRSDFDRALQGGAGQIDFHASEFGGLGEPIEKLKKLSGSPGGAQVGTFAVKVRQKGSEYYKPELGPHFVVASWEGKFRLVALKFNVAKR